MKNTTIAATVTVTVLMLSTVASVAQAQETGRVISSTPLTQQVGVPRQVCTTQPMAFSEPKSGAGAIIGAIAGGGLGSTVGQGGGKALATAVGVIGGAMVGNNLEGTNTQVQNVQQCTTQMFYENRAVGYNVVYEYAGKQYAVQMPNDPGPTVQLQVTPVGASGTQPLMDNAQLSVPPQPMTYVQPNIQPAMTSSTTYVVPSYPPSYPPSYSSYYAPAPVYPSYYGGGYYPPVGISLGFGYRGGHGYGRGGRHWR